MLEKENKSKDSVIEMLREKVKDFDDHKLQLIKAEEKLAKLYTMGLIDSSGEVIPVTPLDDSDEIN